MRTAIFFLVLTAAADAQTLPDPGAFAVDLKPAKPAKPALTRLASGYLWTFADAAEHKAAVQLQESFAEYVARTGKLPPEACFQCSTNHCGTAAGSPTIATGACACGCSAATCNCAHSRNVGKPLSAQLYQPGRRTR